MIPFFKVIMDEMNKNIIAKKFVDSLVLEWYRDEQSLITYTECPDIDLDATWQSISEYWDSINYTDVELELSLIHSTSVVCNIVPCCVPAEFLMDCENEDECEFHWDMVERGFQRIKPNLIQFVKFKLEN